MATAAWTFLSNHAHVLLYLAQHPDALMKTVALEVGITERAVQRIVKDLEDTGYLVRARDGRRNRYQVNRELKLRHPLEAHHAIAELIALMK